MAITQESNSFDWRSHVDLELQVLALDKSMREIDRARVLAADSNEEEKFVGIQRKQNLAHRSLLLNTLNLAMPFKHPYVDAQAAAVQQNAVEASRATVQKSLSALEKRAKQSFALFKPTMSNKTNDKEFNGEKRKNNLRAMDALDLDLSVLSESARARVEKIEASVVAHRPLKH